MSMSNGNPVFQSVGGDASAATVTYTPTGATVAVTMKLSTVAQNVETSSTSAASATETANEAKAAVSGFNDALGKATADSIQTSQIGQPGGIVGIDNGGGVLLNSITGAITYINAGRAGASDQTQLQFFSGSNSTPSSALIAYGGTGNADGNLAFAGAALHPQNNNGGSLGTSNNAWSGIVTQTAPQVVSDANDKTIVGTLGDNGYADITDKLRAAWAAISGVVYTLKNGASDRCHIGAIAQVVQAAFTAQGLDPAEYGLWCSEPRTQIVTTKNEDGSTTTVVQPVYEADGKTQATQQTLRYEELLSLGLFCERLERSDLTARVVALETKAPTAAGG